MNILISKNAELCKNSGINAKLYIFEGLALGDNLVLILASQVGLATLLLTLACVAQLKLYTPALTNN